MEPPAAAAAPESPEGSGAPRRRRCLGALLASLPPHCWGQAAELAALAGPVVSAEALRHLAPSRLQTPLSCPRRPAAGPPARPPSPPPRSTHAGALGASAGSLPPPGRRPARPPTSAGTRRAPNEVPPRGAPTRCPRRAPAFRRTRGTLKAPAFLTFVSGSSLHS